MTQIFDATDNIVPVTLVEVQPVCILEKPDYPTKNVARIGCFPVRENRIEKMKKPFKGYFTKLGVANYKLVREVLAEKNADFSFLATPAPTNNQETQPAEGVSPEEKKPADPRMVGLEIFQEGQIVDVRGTMKGRGFAGGVKRHGWGGQPRAHGHTSHRRIGSAGSNTDPGRKLKGLRMCGHMGDCFRTTKNLKIVKIDTEKQLLFIRGAVPGCIGSVVKVKKVS